MGARALVASLQIDLHGTTVNRWEIVFHACLVSSWCRWYEQMRKDMTARLNDVSEGKHVSRFEVHVAQVDSTNSRQTARIPSMEIKSMFLKLDVVHELYENSGNEF